MPKKILIMKIKNLFLSTVLFCFISVLFAGEIDVNTAKTLAKNFYFAKTNQYNLNMNFSDLNIDSEVTKESNKVAVYHVFTFNKPGFVIVSADDVLPTVLGYSFDSFYSEEEALDSYRNFMQSYADAILYIRENKIQQTAEVNQQWNYYLKSTPEVLINTNKEKSVDPLLDCKWNQDSPYNTLCPEDAGGPGGHAFSGCVATAMAQVMYYWRHPMQGSGSHSYNYYPYGNLSADFGSTYYNWEGMINSIDNGNVYPNAELQYHCGVAVDMMYGAGGSGAYSWDVPYAMENYFGYSTDCYFASKSDFNNTVWENMLKENIDNGWPIYYSGYSNAGGHAFVCNGYQDNYFHFNFGWGGSSNGFYTLLDVNGFNQGQGAVLDTYPTGNYPNYSTGDHVLTQFSGSIVDGSGPIENYQDNTNSSWLIDPQTSEDSITSITLKFFRFETEINDFITIYDGESAQDNLLAEFSGNEIPEAITSNGNKMLIVFSSDNAETASGWYAEYTANKAEYCKGLTTLTEQTGSLSDGSGSFNYYNGTVCMWKIEPEMAETVTLSFTSFNTEAQSDDVKIYDGESQELLATYSGSFSPSNLPDPVTSQSGKMIIIFHSGPSVNSAGWDAEYSSILTGVDNDKISDDEFIVFPNPATQRINIKTPTDYSGMFNIEILSLEGKTQFIQTVNSISQNKQMSVDVSKFTSGIYLLKLTTSEKSVIKRMVKN